MARPDPKISIGFNGLPEEAVIVEAELATLLGQFNAIVNLRLIGRIKADFDFESKSEYFQQFLEPALNAHEQQVGKTDYDNIKYWIEKNLKVL